MMKVKVETKLKDIADNVRTKADNVRTKSFTTAQLCTEFLNDQCDTATCCSCISQEVVQS